MEDDSERASEAAAPFSKPAPFSIEGGDSDDDGKGSKKESKKKKKGKVKEESGPETPGSEGGEAPPEEGGPEGEGEEVKAPGGDQKPLSKTEFVDALKDMDELLKGMSDEVEEDEVDEVEDDEQEA